MLPAASPISSVAKPSQPATAQTATRSAHPQAPETARASTGETAAANVRTETPNALQAPEQTAVAPRLRDQETAERTERTDPPDDQPAGPEPAFEESPLERQARVALDPPDPSEAPVTAPELVSNSTDDAADTPEDASLVYADIPVDPPPTPAEKAEASFTETIAISEPKEPSTVDVAS